MAENPIPINKQWFPDKETGDRMWGKAKKATAEILDIVPDFITPTTTQDWININKYGTLTPKKNSIADLTIKQAENAYNSSQLGQEWFKEMNGQKNDYAQLEKQLATSSIKPNGFIEEGIAAVSSFAGGKAGAAAASFEIEAGMAYREMTQAGVSHKTARNIALSIGGVNGALELVQLDELAKSMKILSLSNNKIIQGALQNNKNPLLKV